MRTIERRDFLALLAGILLGPLPGAGRSWARDCPDIAGRVKKIVIYHLGVDAEKVTESARFIDDLGADSLDTIELTMAMEEEFGLEIPDDAAERMQTVGDVVIYIEDDCAGRSPAIDGSAGGTHRKLEPCPPGEP